MPTVNPTFETAGAAQGQAASWTLASTSALVDVAELDTANIGVENFEDGWRLPMTGPGRVALGAFNTATNVFTDGAASAAGPRLELIARVTTAFTGGPVTLNITYTDNVAGAGRAATVVIPAAAEVGTTHTVTLQGTDQEPLDVTAVAEAAPFAGPGIVDILGFRALGWCEGTFGCRLSSTDSSGNEAAVFSFTGVALVQADFSHGQAFESFEFAWDGNNGQILVDFDMVAGAAVFDGTPDLAGGTETIEDFEEGWFLPRRTTTLLGHYRVSSNAFTDGAATTAQADGAYTLPCRGRARVTVAFENLEMDYDIAYRATAAGGVLEADLTTLAAAQVGEEFYLVPRTPGAGPQVSQIHDIVAHAAGPFAGIQVGEMTPSAIQGEFDLLADELPTAAEMTTGVVIVSLSAQLTIGAGNAAVLYEARALGLAGEVIRVRHTVAPSTPTTSVSVAANDITVSLRTDASSAVLATAAEVAAAVNASEGARPLVQAVAQGTGLGQAAVAGFANLDALTDAASALFDVANQAFEDFEQEWANNQNSITSFTIATAASQTYYRELQIALFDSPTLLGTLTVGGAPEYVDGAAMPQPPYTQNIVGFITAAFVEGGGVVDPRVRYTINAVVGGLVTASRASAHLDQILVGGTNVGGLAGGQSNGFDLTLVDHVDGAGPAPAFSAGAMTLWGGNIAEDFEDNWTLLLP